MNLRLLADENVPRTLVDALISAGHLVAWVRTVAPGASDREVLALADKDRRIVLTFDKDFGEFAACGAGSERRSVILVRLPLRAASSTITSLVGIINGRDDWATHFSVIEPGRVRMRALEP